MANYMEPEALSFQPSGDFKVRSFGRTGPMDGPIREIDDRPDYLRPLRVALPGSLPAEPELVGRPIGGSQWLQPKTDTAAAPTSVADTPAIEKAKQGATTMFGSTFGSDVSTPYKGAALYKRGTARVPGKGSGKKDTVPAMLAPGEAVLNKAAAESMGRGNIAQMNAAGARQMGLGMRGSDEMRHYNMGTSNVLPGSTPFLRQQLAQPDQPAFDAAIPRIDHGPAVGIPNRPARQPAGPPAPPYAPMNTAGWANPGAMNYGSASQPPGPNMNALYGTMAPPAWDADFVNAHGGGQADTLPPAMMMPEQPFQPPIMQPTGYGMRPNPSLGGQRARGGLSAFEQAFSAARKGGQSEFNYRGGRYNTKLREG